MLGAGGHAKVMIEALRAAGWTPGGLLTPDPDASALLGVPVLGGDDALNSLRDRFEAVAVAVGDNQARVRIGANVRMLGYALPPVIHPTAHVSPSATVGEGAVVMARAVVGALARIGSLAIVNTGAMIEHVCVSGAAADVAPGAVLAGAVTVCARALVGIGAVARPGVVVGADAVVGAGAAVIAAIPPGAVWAGVPAQPLGRP